MQRDLGFAVQHVSSAAWVYTKSSRITDPGVSSGLKSQQTQLMQQPCTAVHHRILSTDLTRQLCPPIASPQGRPHNCAPQTLVHRSHQAPQCPTTGTAPASWWHCLRSACGSWTLAACRCLLRWRCWPRSWAQGLSGRWWTAGACSARLQGPRCPQVCCDVLQAHLNLLETCMLWLLCK
jgi:hypothetical protein